MFTYIFNRSFIIIKKIVDTLAVCVPEPDIQQTRLVIPLTIFFVTLDQIVGGARQLRIYGFTVSETHFVHAFTPLTLADSSTCSCTTGGAQIDLVLWQTATC